MDGYFGVVVNARVERVDEWLVVGGWCRGLFGLGG